MQLNIQMTFHKPKQLGYINISGYTSLANKRLKHLAHSLSQSINRISEAFKVTAHKTRDLNT